MEAFEVCRIFDPPEWVLVVWVVDQAWCPHPQVCLALLRQQVGPQRCHLRDPRQLPLPLSLKFKPCHQCRTPNFSVVTVFPFPAHLLIILINEFDEKEGWCSVGK